MANGFQAYGGGVQADPLTRQIQSAQQLLAQNARPTHTAVAQPHAPVPFNGTFTPQSLLEMLQRIGVQATPEALPILARGLSPGGDLMSAIAEVQQYGSGSGTYAGSGQIGYYDAQGNYAGTRTPTAQEALAVAESQWFANSPHNAFRGQTALNTNFGTTTVAPPPTSNSAVMGSPASAMSAASPQARNAVAGWVQQTGARPTAAQVAQLESAFDNWQAGRSDIGEFVRIGSAIQTASTGGAGAAVSPHAVVNPHAVVGAPTGNVAINAGMQDVLANVAKIGLPVVGNIFGGGVGGAIGGVVGNAVAKRIQGGGNDSGSTPTHKVDIPAEGTPKTPLTDTGTPKHTPTHKTEETPPMCPQGYVWNGYACVPVTGNEEPFKPIPHVPPPPLTDVGYPHGGYAPPSEWTPPQNISPYSQVNHTPTHVRHTGTTGTTTGTTPQTNTAFSDWIQDYMRSIGTGVWQGQQDFGQEALFRNSLGGLSELSDSLQAERLNDPNAGATAPALQTDIMKRISTTPLPENVGTMDVTPAFGALSHQTTNALTNLSTGGAAASPYEAFTGDQLKGRATGTLTPTETALRNTTGTAVGNVDVTNKFLQPHSGLTADLTKATGAQGPTVAAPHVSTSGATRALGALESFAPTAGKAIAAPHVAGVGALDTTRTTGTLDTLKGFEPTKGTAIAAPHVAGVGALDTTRTTGALGKLGSFTPSFSSAAGANTQNAIGAFTNMQTTNVDATRANTLAAGQTAGLANLAPMQNVATSPLVNNAALTNLSTANLNVSAPTAAYKDAQRVLVDMQYPSPDLSRTRTLQNQTDLGYGALNRDFTGSPASNLLQTDPNRAALAGVNTTLAESAYLPQAANVLSSSDPATAALIQTLQTRAQGGMTAQDEAAQNAYLDMARRAVLQYDRSDPMGLGARGLAGSGVAQGLFAREAGRVAQDTASQLALLAAQRQGQSVDQLTNVLGQELQRRTGQAGVLTNVGGMAQERGTTSLNAELAKQGQVAGMSQEALAATMGMQGQVAAQRAEQAATEQGQQQQYTVQRGQQELTRINALADAFMRSGDATQAAAAQTASNRLQQLMASGQLTQEALNAILASVQGTALAQGGQALEAQGLAQDLALQRSALELQRVAGLSGASLDVQQLEVQARAQADALRLQAQEASVQGNVALANELNQRADILLRGALGAGELQLGAQTAEAGRQQAADALRLQARQAELEGNIGLANELNQRAALTLQGQLGAGELSLGAQTAEAGRLQSQDQLRVQADIAAANGNLELANVYRMLADSAAQTGIQSAQLGLQERMGSRELLVGAGESQADRALQQATAQEQTNLAARGLEAGTVESALGQLGQQGAGVAERTLQGQLGAGNLLAGREATGAQFALGTAQLNADLKSQDANRRLQAEQTAADQMIRMGEQVQSGELSRAQLTQMAKEGNLDGILETMGLMANQAIAREGLSQNVRQQGIQMASVLSQYQTESRRLDEMTRELDFQIAEAQKNRDLVTSQFLDKLKADASESKWAVAGQVAAGLLTAGGYWLANRK